jgi:hypothetical protein
MNVSGLTAHASENYFARALGTPVNETENAPSGDVREVRRVWRTDGYLIDATFLGAERSSNLPFPGISTKGNKTFPKGALVWFEVSRGL